MFEKLAGRDPEILIDDHDRHYAVAVPYRMETQSILFEVRADSLKRQPGEVSFPGGLVEAGETPLAAAVRETAEELLVPQGDVEVVAPLDVLFHLSASVIHPFLAVLRDYGGTFSPCEVKEVFEVPFAHFLHSEPRVYHNEVSVTAADPDFPYDLLGTPSYPWAVARHEVLFYPYEGHVIWGMTARIMKNAVDLYRAAYGA